MKTHVTGIDHVIIAVRDLEAARQGWERLGFVATPKGSHGEWGTANHCFMFAEDYVELLAPEAAGPVAESVRAFTDRREGLMSVVLASDEGAALADRLRRAGHHIPTPQSLTRKIPQPGGGEATAQFSVFSLPVDTTPGVECRVVQHLTPDLLRRPDWVAHPNGAVGLASVSAIVEEPGELMPAWDAVFGPHATTPTDNTVAVHTGRGLIFLSRPDELSQLHPEAEDEELPHAPALLVLTLLVEDTGRAAALLKANKVEFTRDSEGTIRIPPEEANGVFLEMVARS